MLRSNFLVNGVLPEHGYRAEFSADGKSLKWKRAIPDYFFESKRMMIMLGKEYHHNDTRVIAHLSRLCRFVSCRFMS